MTKSKSCQSCSIIIFHGKGKEMTSGTLYSNTDCSIVCSHRYLIIYYTSFINIKSFGCRVCWRGNHRYGHYHPPRDSIRDQCLPTYSKESSEMAEAPRLDYFDSDGRLFLIPHHLSRSQSR